MTLETLNACRKHRLRILGLEAAIKAGYNTARSVDLTRTASRSGRRSERITEKAVLNSLDLQEKLQKEQLILWQLMGEVEDWLDEEEISPGAAAGIRLYYICDM